MAPKRVVATLWTWPAAVSIGTLALAGFTAWLAWNTRNAVNQSKEQIKLSQRELEILEIQTGAMQVQADAVREQAEATKGQAEATNAQVALATASLEATARPVLVGAIGPSPSGRDEVVHYRGGHDASIASDAVDFLADEEMIHLSVPLKNVGQGVAFVQRVALLNYDLPEGRISLPVVPPGEMTRVRFALARRTPIGQATNANDITGEGGRGFVNFTVLVVYSAASSELITTSHVEISGPPFFVAGNEIFDGNVNPRRLTSSANVG